MDEKKRFEVRLVSNGDYLQWIRDGQSYRPAAKRILPDVYETEEEAERAGKEAWNDGIDELDHIVVYDVSDAFSY